MSEKMPELKCCPLDGGEIKHHTDIGFHHGDRGYKPKSEDFTCNSCGLILRVRGDEITKAEAFKQWNTRADLAQPAPASDAVERAIDGMLEMWGHVQKTVGVNPAWPHHIETILAALRGRL